MKTCPLRTAKIRIYFDMTMIKSLFIFLTSFTVYSFTLLSFDGLHIFGFHHYPRILLLPNFRISLHISLLLLSVINL